ncbi:hypothetical protein HNQ59_004022, partial [Chitinivorax tropicus]|nr:hypothetical protein [Chitinivorax tropicus]
GKGLPDWNILPLEYTPGTLYSNPLPVRLERVVPGGVELGGGLFQAEYSTQQVILYPMVSRVLRTTPLLLMH